MFIEISNFICAQITNVVFTDFIYNILSFKYANTLERLTPINVLIAPVIIRLILFSGDVPIFWSTGQMVSKFFKDVQFSIQLTKNRMFQLSMFLACLLTTYISSSILYILLDGPLMAALESLLGIHKA